MMAVFNISLALSTSQGAKWLGSGDPTNRETPRNFALAGIHRRYGIIHKNGSG